MFPLLPSKNGVHRPPTPGQPPCCRATQRQINQFRSREHRALLDTHGLVASMSAKGNCYDNAAMESWNHGFNVEAIHGEHLGTREQAKSHVFDYVEVDYNRNRLHSTLG